MQARKPPKDPPNKISLPNFQVLSKDKQFYDRKSELFCLLHCRESKYMKPYLYIIALLRAFFP